MKSEHLIYGSMKQIAFVQPICFALFPHRRTVFKSLLGRYYRTIDRENNRDEIEGSFIDARAAINTHTQTHLSSQQSQRQEEEPFDKHDWEELC